MIPRYTLREMGEVWTDRARFEAMLRVEVAVIRAQARHGLVPQEAADAVASRSRVDVDRIAEIELTTDHDVIAFVSQVAETVGPEGRFLHLGLTSSDVLDTGLALQCRAASDRLLADLDAAVEAVVRRAREHATTLMMGRTHSVHAEPITFGFKLAGWAFELDRDRRRVAAAASDIATGKLSGPVGTYSHVDPAIEAEVMSTLGLAADPVSTQIVQRDRHAAFLAALAVTGGSLERFATEVRNLQHTEIGEVQEPFRSGQKGSSAMPHKRNPIVSERLAGMARLLRGYAQAGLENQALWHERDISHSSVERVVLPDATILLDYMLVTFTRLVDGLVVRPERMRENLELGLGLHASSRVLVALVERGGLGRDEAYGVVQRAALRASDERRPLAELLAEDPAAAALPAGDLAACFDDGAFLAHVATVMTRLDRVVPPATAGGPGAAVEKDRPGDQEAAATGGIGTKTATHVEGGRG
jgi:adenylosuccinate lyase